MKPTVRFCVIAMMLTGSLVYADDRAQQAIDPQQLFEDAMAQLESGKIYAAIELFETLLNDNPTLNRARLELGVAYHKASRLQEAQRQFKIVLDDPNTPEQVRLAILAYLGQLASDASKPIQQHDFNYYLKAGLLHNSNINSSPGSNLVRLPNNAFSIPAAKISSSGVEFGLGASHRYSLNTPMNVADEATLFEWQSQASLLSNLYENTSDYNLNIVSISTGPALISPGHWRALANFAVDQFYFGTSSLVTLTSFNPVITFDLGNYTGLTLEASLVSQSYARPQDAARDSTETVYGIALSKLFDGTHYGIEVGARMRDNNADADEFSYDGSEIYLGGFITASTTSSVYLNLSHNTFDYETIDPGFGALRDETEKYAALGYNYEHQSGFLQGWALNAEASVIKTDADIDAFDYRRTLFSLNWSKNIQ